MISLPRVVPFFSHKIILAGIFAVFLLDLLTPLGIAIGVLYLIVFVLLIRFPVRAILAYSLLCIFFTLFKLWLFYDEGVEPAVHFNRLISVSAIIIGTALAAYQSRLNKKLERVKDEYIQRLERKKLKLSAYTKALNEYLLLMVLDNEGKIISVNEQMCAVTKYSEAALKGKGFEIFSGKETNRELQQSVEFAKTWRGEIKGFARDGTVFWIDTVLLPVMNSEGLVDHFFTVSLPVTERKQLEEKQQENLEAFKSIVWKISHKLRAPIATCRGFTNLLEAELSGNATELQMKAFYHRKSCTRELDEFSRELTAFVLERYRKEQ